MLHIFIARFFKERVYRIKEKFGVHLAFREKLKITKIVMYCVITALFRISINRSLVQKLLWQKHKIAGYLLNVSIQRTKYILFLHWNLNILFGLQKIVSEEKARLNIFIRERERERGRFSYVKYFIINKIFIIFHDVSWETFVTQMCLSLVVQEL